MTVGQVTMHRAGIRHYYKKPDVHIIKKNSENSKKNKLAHEILEEERKYRSNSETNGSMIDSGCIDGASGKVGNESAKAIQEPNRSGGEGRPIKSDHKPARAVPAKELHTMEKYHNVGESLSVFKDDELIHKPGKYSHISPSYSPA